MPLAGIDTYVMTTDEFLAHWSNVNADRVAATLPALVLRGNYAIVDLTADRDDLQTAISQLEGLENSREIATSTRDSLKEDMKGRLGQFRAGIDLHLSESPYRDAVPVQPNSTSIESKFLRPFDDMQDLWGKINADTGLSGFTPPLLLRGGYTRANFTADLAELQQQFRTVTETESDLTVARRKRDELLEPLRNRLHQYQAAIELEYGPGHPLFESMPRLYPADAGGGDEGEGGETTVPAAPGSPSLTILAPGQVGVTFALVPGATAYRIWKLVLGQESGFNEVGVVGGSPTTITTLPPGETVQIRLTAINAAGESEPGPYAEITLPAPPP